MPQKCSNEALCFRLTKISPKDARIMYKSKSHNRTIMALDKSQAYNPLIKAQIFQLERRRFEKLCLPLEKSGFAPDYGVSIC